MGSTVGLAPSVLAGRSGLVGRLSAYRRAVLYAMELCAYNGSNGDIGPLCIFHIKRTVACLSVCVHVLKT